MIPAYASVLLLLSTVRPPIVRTVQNLNRRGPSFNFLTRLSTRFYRTYSSLKHGCHHHETEMSTLGRSSAQTASTSWLRFFLNAGTSDASPGLPSSRFTNAICVSR
jgi:hypothetical protein